MPARYTQVPGWWNTALPTIQAPQAIISLSVVAVPPAIDSPRASTRSTPTATSSRSTEKLAGPTSSTTPVVVHTAASSKGTAACARGSVHSAMPASTARARPSAFTRAPPAAAPVATAAAGAGPAPQPAGPHRRAWPA